MSKPYRMVRVRSGLEYAVEQLIEFSHTPPSPDDLLELADVLSAMLLELRNRNPRTAGTRMSVRMTPELKARLRQFHSQHPDMPQHKLGALFGVNQGRVSETLTGKRQ
jgi:hypothetical protein